MINNSDFYLIIITYNYTDDKYITLTVYALIILMLPLSVVIILHCNKCFSKDSITPMS